MMVMVMMMMSVRAEDELLPTVRGRLDCVMRCHKADCRAWFKGANFVTRFDGLWGLSLDMFCLRRRRYSERTRCHGSNEGGMGSLREDGQAVRERRRGRLIRKRARIERKKNGR